MKATQFLYWTHGFFDFIGDYGGCQKSRDDINQFCLIAKVCEVLEPRWTLLVLCKMWPEFSEFLQRAGRAVRSTSIIINEGHQMNTETKQSLLKIALAAFGVIFLLVYPVGLVWPSGGAGMRVRVTITCK